MGYRESLALRVQILAGGGEMMTLHHSCPGLMAGVPPEDIVELGVGLDKFPAC